MGDVTAVAVAADEDCRAIPSRKREVGSDGQDNGRSLGLVGAVGHLTDRTQCRDVIAARRREEAGWLGAIVGIPEAHDLHLRLRNVSGHVHRWALPGIVAVCLGGVLIAVIDVVLPVILILVQLV